MGLKRRNAPTRMHRIVGILRPGKRLLLLTGIGEAMDKWIEEMGEYTKRVPNYKNGDLVSLATDENIISYCPKYDSNEITLEGDFTIHQLQSLINHMQKYTKEEE